MSHQCLVVYRALLHDFGADGRRPVLVAERRYWVRGGDQGKTPRRSLVLHHVPVASGGRSTRSEANAGKMTRDFCPDYLTVHPNPNHKNSSDFAEFLRPEESLVRYIIPKEIKEKGFAKLWSLGVRCENLFPDPEGAAKGMRLVRLIEMTIEACGPRLRPQMRDDKVSDSELPFLQGHWR